jgi:hypothetical protein
MAESVRLATSKDTVYTLNGYGALGGLQRFNYSYAANEEDINEIGNSVSAATSSDPTTSMSFEITDTGALAAIFARMTYDYATQEYEAGVTTDITTNAFSFTEDDLQYLIFTAGEYKAPGDIFDQAVLFPYHFVSSFTISLTADGIGNVSMDSAGSLFKPIYKPYHTTRAYAVQYASDTTVDIGAGWSVSSGTHGILGLEVNNKIIEDTNLAWSASDTVTISGGDTVSTSDRLMLWAFELTPSSSVPSIDYVNAIRFVKPDRINIWLIPSGTSPGTTDNYLRVQALDFTVDLAREELREIAKNEQGSAVFYQAPSYPLDITGTIRIYETSLEKFAELQGKTLNESATTGSVDTDNILSSNDFQDAKIVVEWYKYGDDNPIQRLTSDNVAITGYDSTQEVLGRKEATWNFSTSDFLLQGFDV